VIDPTLNKSPDRPVVKHGLREREISTDPYYCICGIHSMINEDIRQHIIAESQKATW
jgi:hypothetical protein